MDTLIPPAGKVLVVSDSQSDAVLVRDILEDDCEAIILSIVLTAAWADIERQEPDIVLLVFRDVHKTREFCQQRFRQNGAPPLLNHRTIVLCPKEQVNEAYDLWLRGLVDDYVVFWPITDDVPRLRMAARRAGAELQALRNKPTAVLVVAQARRIAELRALLANGPETDSRAADRSSEAAGHPRKSLSATRPPDVPEELVAEAIPEAASDAAATPVPPAGASGLRPNILIVDDDRWHRELARHTVEEAGYEAREVSSGEAALSILRSMQFDLVLLDIKMPGIDGLQVLNRLKAERFPGALRVIMTTSNSGRNMVISSLKLGATDFITKPFNRALLLEKVARALQAAPMKFQPTAPA
ncbi:MAG TPA: response regulator [Steroidobacteraceae bacterium]|nr:response regulator [Steroidobacteraceae bacterium]